MKRFFQFTHWAMETLRGKNRGERGILPRRRGVDRFATCNGTRSLRMESLEERQLLSVTPTEYAEIRSTYAEFGLAENMDEINLIEITKLSTANLKAAIETASQTEADDLIVIRTTESASSIIFTREANEIKISLDSSAKGTLSIVGYGDAPFSINANNKCRAITVESGTVNFGNILLKNGSTSGYGAGLNNVGGRIIASNCVFTACSSLGSYASGGGVSNQTRGNLTLKDCVISNNTVTGSYAGLGAGVSNEYGTLTMTGCDVYGNVVTGTSYNLGAGVCNNYGTMFLTNSTIHDNEINGSKYCLGGGVCNGGDATLIGLVIYNNSATYGAGIGTQETMTAINCTVTGNTATYGGGIWVYGESAEKTSTVYLQNMIIVGNLAKASGHEVYRYNSFVSVYADHTLSRYRSWDVTGSEKNYIYDESKPLFTDAENFDFTLAEGSQAADRGLNGYVTLTTDAAGNYRIMNRTVDMGAYETQTGDPVLLSPTGLTLSAEGGGVTASFDEVFGANLYEVYYSLSSTFSNVTKVTTRSTSISVSGLERGTVYYFRVKARDTSGSYTDSSYSQTAAIRTSASVVLDAPESLTITSYGANRHQAVWSAVENASGYLLEYSVEGRDCLTTISTDGTSSIVTGLEYGLAVTYRVKALGDGNAYLDSEWSGAKTLYVFPMDINGDKIVSSSDMAFLSKAWLSRPSSSNWDPASDIDGNGIIASSDLAYISVNWLKRPTSSDLTFPPEKAEWMPDEGVLPNDDVIRTTSEEGGSDVMALASKPDSDYIIYLDFDGHLTTGTSWNTVYTDGEDIITPRFNLDGDSTKDYFTDAEKTAIYNIWLRVSEDYLPFDVNVTTVEPESTVFTSGKAIRVCIGGSCQDWLESSAAGISFVSSFTWKNDTPNFVFSGSLNGNVKNVAETVSHEVGHTLGLSHSGSSRIPDQEEYYQGAEGWAPIMGASYYQELTQWSKGEYDGATSKQDQLKIISTRNGFTYREDDSPSFDEPLVLTLTEGAGSVSGIIERNTDVDYVLFESDGRPLNFRVGGIDGVTNLDALVKIYDADREWVVTYDPQETLYVEFVFEGTAGTYYLTVEGTGKETSEPGIYSDYGSLGAYDVTVGNATTVMVTTLEDSIDPSDGKISLREAVLWASERTTILFDNALAGGTITLVAGEIEVNKTIVIDATSVGGITIDADDASRIFYVTGALTIQNLTLTGGRIAEEGSDQYRGGAIYNTGTLTVVDSVLTGNVAEENGQYLIGGGALYNETEATANLIRTTISANHGNFGGAIFNTGTVVLTDSTFEGNASYAYRGGAIYNSGSLTVSGGAFIANESADYSGYTVGGGAIYNHSGGTVSVVGTDFATNSAVFGGAVMNDGTMTMDKITATGNFSIGNKGGAIYNAGTLTITNSNFSGNRSIEDGAKLVGGGGIYNAQAGQLTVVNSLFTGNAGNFGGAIFNYGTATLTNLTVTGNTALAAAGGGLFVYSKENVGTGVAVLSNNIFVGNLSSSQNADLYDYNGTVDGVANLIGVTNWEDATAVIAYDSSKLLYTDATGGDYSLRAGSQAIDIGLNNVVESDVDLAGQTRIVNEIVDLGAYEYQGGPLEPLDAPSIGTIASAGKNRHQVTWDAIGNASGYVLGYSTDQIGWTTIQSADPSFTVTGLTYGDLVYYRVKAVGDGVVYSDSDWSESKSLYVCPMDVNGDKIVSSADLTIVSKAWISRPTSSNWDPRADIDGNGIVAASDVTFISMNWMKRVTASDLVYPASDGFWADEVDSSGTLTFDLDSIFTDIFDGE